MSALPSAFRPVASTVRCDRLWVTVDDAARLAAFLGMRLDKIAPRLVKQDDAQGGGR